MDSNDFFTPNSKRLHLGEFELSGMTDEEKLLAAGFSQFGTTYKLNHRNNFGVWSLLVDTQEFYAELSQFKNLQWVSRLKTEAQTVDEVITLARLLGLSKEAQ